MSAGLWPQNKGATELGMRSKEAAAEGPASWHLQAALEALSRALFPDANATPAGTQSAAAPPVPARTPGPHTCPYQPCLRNEHTLL